MKSGIYIILNIVNNKRYVGSAVNVQSRLRTHKANLNLNKHPNKHLQSAYNLEPKSFVLFAIEYCEVKNLLSRERIWINYFNSHSREFGYNRRKEPNSNIGLGGYKQSAEWIEKRTSKLRGRKHTEQAILNNQKAQKGKKLSDVHRMKLSISGIGHLVSQETKAKIGKANSNPDKWPHGGNACKCRECLDKKNEMRKNNTKLKRELKIQKRFEGATWVN